MEKTYKLVSIMKYRIANTLIQTNLNYDPVLKYKTFSVDEGKDSGFIEIIFGNCDPYVEDYVKIIDNVNFYYDQYDNLCFRIFDHSKKLVIGTMTFSDDFNSATIKHRSFDHRNHENKLDVFFFLFFQVYLLFTPGISLHASALNWKGQAILFSAPSGTGKSTQAKLWVKHEGAEIFNGDRPAVTINNNKIYAHGTPWSGSDAIFKNINIPTKAIVLLEQSTDNLCERLSPEEAVNLLLPRVFMPYFDEQLTTRALDIVNQIIQKVPIYKLKCRPDVGAVEVLKKELSLLPE